MQAANQPPTNSQATGQATVVVNVDAKVLYVVVDFSNNPAPIDAVEVSPVITALV